MALQTSTAWQFAALHGLYPCQIKRLLDKIDAQPVGRAIIEGAHRKSDLYTLDDLNAALQMVPKIIEPPAGVETRTINEFAAEQRVSSSAALRHIRNHNLQPVGRRYTDDTCRKMVDLYDLRELEAVAVNFARKTGWSEAHERTVRKYPIPKIDRLCRGCGVKKPYSEFSRHSSESKGGGYYLQCKACRSDKPAPGQRPVGLDNDLCRAFLRASL